VCLSGDGGIGYHIGDFESAVRLGLPVVVIVLNNRMLAFEYHGQKYKYNNRIVPEVNNLSDLDHSAVARGFGWQGRRVRTIEEFTAALDDALNDSTNPWMIDVVVDREDFAPITNYDGVLERSI
jgi:acetolactate synthase I/II/III large subunit